LGPIPNPQSPIPNPQSPFLLFKLLYKFIILRNNYFKIFILVFIIKLIQILKYNEVNNDFLKMTIIKIQI